MTDNHASVTVTREDAAFLMRRCGPHFPDVTTSNLVEIDFDGNIPDAVIAVVAAVAL